MLNVKCEAIVALAVGITYAIPTTRNKSHDDAPVRMKSVTHHYYC